METIRFTHGGNCGDIIYSLPSIKMICEKKNAKAEIYIHLNVPSDITSHPVKSESGHAVMVSRTMFDMLKPLLESQPYIKSVYWYETEAIPPIDYDLDLFRQDYANLSAGNIAQWIGNSYPELRPNLYEKSIIFDSLFVIPRSPYIVVNRSSRYQNILVDYSQLKNYEYIYFVGIESEFKALSLHNPNLKHYIINDFKELAEFIRNAKLFIGNQSMAFAIAEQLKVPRILEQYAHAPNVIPQGGEYWVTHNNKQFQKALSLALNGKDSDSDKAQIRQTDAQAGC